MAMTASYYPDYFSLTDILASQERLTCKIEQDLPRLGFLDESSDHTDLKAGTKLELPLWLALSLNAKQPPTVTIDIPKMYKEAHREILKADACAVELSKWNLYYYEVGIQLAKCNHTESEKIADILLHTFKARFRHIMDWAQNPGTDLTIGNRMPILERNLFLTGRKARMQLIEWLEKGGGNIKTAEMVVIHKKRKRGGISSNSKS
ncbi:DNA replication complex GINS protein PSF3 [Orussus abietinus]|uniref:DNA replication complex GINS protein PSF3 n=1 Tax=Orussus abietinus TaxID=222816 RepID=UPI00062557B8|nr:DNA replication complex GINS protein PSF3 [Orussus abietinus]